MEVRQTVLQHQHAFHLPLLLASIMPCHTTRCTSWQLMLSQYKPTTSANNNQYQKGRHNRYSYSTYISALILTLTFNRQQAMVMANTQGKNQGQRSVGSKDGMEIYGRIDRQMDTTNRIILPSNAVGKQLKALRDIKVTCRKTHSIQ